MKTKTKTKQKTLIFFIFVNALLLTFFLCFRFLFFFLKSSSLLALHILFSSLCSLRQLVFIPLSSSSYLLPSTTTLTNIFITTFITRHNHNKTFYFTPTNLFPHTHTHSLLHPSPSLFLSLNLFTCLVTLWWCMKVDTTTCRRRQRSRYLMVLRTSHVLFVTTATRTMNRTATGPVRQQKTRRKRNLPSPSHPNKNRILIHFQFPFFSLYILLFFPLLLFIST